jgi:putative hydrolase of the HAD superfamily
MLELVRKISSWNIGCAILSDQVNWLKMLNERQAFFPLFDRVFNSFEIGQSKRDPELFSRVVSWLGVAPEEALFIDDSSGNVDRARSRGLEAIHYTGRKAFTAALRTFCPGI